MVNPQPFTDNADEKIAGVKIAIGGGGVLLYGLTLENWVAVLTIAYMILQIGLLMPKYCVMVARTYHRWFPKS